MNKRNKRGIYDIFTFSKEIMEVQNKKLNSGNQESKYLKKSCYFTRSEIIVALGMQ